eukprot:12616827-Alexandrium_andersonii.AAC.1
MTGALGRATRLHEAPPSKVPPQESLPNMQLRMPRDVPAPPVHPPQDPTHDAGHPEPVKHAPCEPSDA